MKRLFLVILYTFIGTIFTKNITYFDKLGIVEHKNFLSDNTNNNGIIGDSPNPKSA